MFLLSGQKGKDARKADRRFGGRRSVSEYRHPLIARLTLFLSSILETADASVRRRVRWTPGAASLAAILMAWNHDATLSTACRRALRCLAGEGQRRRSPGSTYNGLLKALERQGPQVLPRLRADLRRQVRSYLEGRSGFSDWTLLAVDGSKDDLPRTRDHERAFGMADNGAFPQAFVTAIVEVRSGCPWDWRIDRADASERHHLMEMIPHLPPRSLLLADGNYVGFPLWSALHQAAQPFLIRVGVNVH
jgi:hypothetical protein